MMPVFSQHKILSDTTLEPRSILGPGFGRKQRHRLYVKRSPTSTRAAIIDISESGLAEIVFHKGQSQRLK